MKRLENILNIANKSNKELVVYISMGFGNHYGDAWSPEIVADWTKKLNTQFGIRIFALSDTVGVATPELISNVLNITMPELKGIEVGVHLHTTIETYAEKVKAAYEAGCRRFDGAIRGFGGCPMAEDELVGNMPTEKMVSWFTSNNIETGLNLTELEKSVLQSSFVFH